MLAGQPQSAHASHYMRRLCLPLSSALYASMSEHMLYIYAIGIYIVAIAISCRVARRIYKSKGYPGIPLWSIRYIFVPPLVVFDAFISRTPTNPSTEYRNQNSHIAKEKMYQEINAIVTFSEEENGSNSLCLKCSYYKPQYSICSKLKTGISNTVVKCRVYQDSCV